MFQRRLALILGLLALAVVAQGVGAAGALQVAETQVHRGRVASDLRSGFYQLSATKQRLRTWVAQRQAGVETDPLQREALQADMLTLLASQRALAERAIELDDDPSTRVEHLQRLAALDALDAAMPRLHAAVDRAAPLAEGADVQQAWGALTDLFEGGGGGNLRSLIASGIDRETEALRRERAAADKTLLWVRRVWLSTGTTLAVCAVLAAILFVGALRQRLDALSRGASALQAGQLDHRIRLDGRDEFALIAQSFDSMAIELEQHRALDAAQRMRLEVQVQARTEELQRALQALQQSDLQRRRLFADISHELRTPTTAIRGEAEVTLRGADRSAEEYKATLERVRETARHLGSVIDDLLTMARTDLDALVLSRQPIDLSQPLREALTQARALAGARGVELIAPEPGEGRWCVVGDSQRLRQVLGVLLDNAVRYSHVGGVARVEINAETDARLGTPFVTVDVIDGGIGLGEKEMPYIFDRHFRGAEAQRHHPGGSGLGLPIARVLAHAHGGRLELSSTTGGGTRARLALPLHIVGEPAAFEG